MLPFQCSLILLNDQTNMSLSVATANGFTLGPKEYPRLGRKDRHKEKCQTRETVRDYRAQAEKNLGITVVELL